MAFSHCINRWTTWLSGLFLLVALSSADARQFRQSQRILSPETTNATSVVSVPQKIQDQLPAVDIDAVNDLISQALANWNTPGMGDWLGNEFYNRQRLLNTMDQNIPRDASLRIKAIQGLRVFDQRFIAPSTQGQISRVSTVIANVQTQIEFNDPTQGFVRLDGNSEMTFSLSETFAQ